MENLKGHKQTDKRMKRADVACVLKAVNIVCFQPGAIVAENQMAVPEQKECGDWRIEECSVCSKGELSR